MHNKVRPLSSFTLLGLLASGVASAADDGWKHTVAIYGVGASMDGSTSVGPVTADVDVSFSDILDNLEFAAMFAYRGERGRWAVGTDLIYMKLEQSKDGIGPAGNSRSTVEADQLILELNGSYALTEHLSLYGGFRYWDLEVDLEVQGGGPLGETLATSQDEDWIDPMVGLRYALPLGERWTLIAKADLGGFGFGSDRAWQATGLAAWSLSEHADLLFGFRWLDVDYEDGLFKYNVGQGGPTVGFAWVF
jgi:hypothetical protein